MLRLFNGFGRSLSKANVLRFSPILCVTSVNQSTNLRYRNGKEPYEEFRERFLNAFNDASLDSWWLRHWMQNLHFEDIVPPPEIVSSALHACRRQNDLALAIRFLEAVRIKCKPVSGAWEWMKKEISPTMKELGIPTLAELGYEAPELALPHQDDWSCQT